MKSCNTVLCESESTTGGTMDAQVYPAYKKSDIIQFNKTSLCLFEARPFIISSMDFI